MSQATCPRRALRLAAASVGVIALGGLGLSALTAAPQPDPLGEKTGGDTTVYATGRNAFSFPAANLPDDERTRFVIGNSFFRRNWVEAPASTKARDGLGPHFIARSCGGCHVQDGRGASRCATTPSKASLPTAHPTHCKSPCTALPTWATAPCTPT